MRRLERVAGAGHASRLHGAKTKTAGLVQRTRSEAEEIRIESDVRPIVFGMGVAARRVCLPDLDQAIDDRLAFVVPNMAGNLDAFARNALASCSDFGDAIIVAGLNQIGSGAKRGIAGKIGAAFPRQAEMKERPRRLPRRLHCHSQCSMGVALRPRSTKSKR